MDKETIQRLIQYLRVLTLRYGDVDTETGYCAAMSDAIEALEHFRDTGQVPEAE